MSTGKQAEPGGSSKKGRAAPALAGSITERDKRRGELIALFEALPFDEQVAAMQDLLLRRKKIVPVSDDVPPIPDPRDPIAGAFWVNAIAEHRLGKPERLSRLLAGAAPLNGLAGGYLAELVTHSAKRNVVGRPSKKEDYAKFPGLLDEILQEHRFKVEFVRVRERWQRVAKAERGASTPSELALAEMAKTYAMSVADVSRRIYGRKPTVRKTRQNF